MSDSIKTFSRPPLTGLLHPMPLLRHTVMTPTSPDQRFLTVMQDYKPRKILVGFTSSGAGRIWLPHLSDTGMNKIVRNLHIFPFHPLPFPILKISEHVHVGWARRMLHMPHTCSIVRLPTLSKDASQPACTHIPVLCDTPISPTSALNSDSGLCRLSRARAEMRTQAMHEMYAVSA
jgi:hypothetical protein